MARANRPSSASSPAYSSPTRARSSWTGGRSIAASPHHAGEAGMSFIHQELAFVPDMTVIENIMLGLPKTHAAWLGGLDGDGARGGPGRPPRRGRGPARCESEGAFDRRELAHQHSAGAHPQVAPHRHGRTDGGAVGRARATGCSKSFAACARQAWRCFTSRTGSTKCSTFASASPCSAMAARSPNSAGGA